MGQNCPLNIIGLEEGESTLLNKGYGFSVLGKYPPPSFEALITPHISLINVVMNVAVEHDLRHLLAI